jgi:membrane fusion protein, copper/silver efflux system
LTTVELPACLDPLTQAVRLRLEAENPDYLLRPDMFVDVDLPITLPPTIAVPVEAVLDSGREKIVFVERGTGVFEKRVVRTGWRFGGRVEIVDGLIPGERIVASGVFHLESESRMRPPPARLESAR